MVLYRINGQINWLDLVGVEVLSPNNTKMIATTYNDNKLYIGEWVSDTEGYTNVIVTLNEGRALEQLRLLGYDLQIIDKPIEGYSQETIDKIRGLIQAGFTYLSKSNDNNYKVDDIFTQNILKSEELNNLLNNNVEKINLLDMVN